MRRHGFTARMFACAAALLAACPSAGHSAPATTVTLKNGLRVVLAPDSTATAVDVGVWYATGTRWERDGMTGVTHLLERLMFRGSATVKDGEHARALLAEGATANTSTSPDYSCLWETVPAEALPLALRLEADRMAGLKPSAQAFESEKSGARADRRARGQRAALVYGIARLQALVFAGHPYARSAYGADADLARMTPADVEAWRREHYGAGGAALTIVGRFEPEGTLMMVRRLFEPLPRGAAPAPPGVKTAPPAAGRRGWERGDAPARLVFAGWRAPGAADPDVPALEVLVHLLSDGDDARLHRALMTDGSLALLTQGGIELHREGSLAWTLAALRPDADSSATERVLLDEVHRLARDPVSGEDLDRVKASLVTSELFRLQRVRARGQALGESLMLTGDAAAADSRLAAIDRVTPADLQRVARRVFADNSQGVLWLVPAGEAR